MMEIAQHRLMSEGVASSKGGFVNETSLLQIWLHLGLDIEPMYADRLMTWPMLYDPLLI